VVDKAAAISDFLGAGDHQALAFFNGLNEVGGLEKQLVCAGVQPGRAAAEDAHIQLAQIEGDANEVGDLKLTSGGGFHLSRGLSSGFSGRGAFSSLGWLFAAARPDQQFWHRIRLPFCASSTR
jgi:hypothetical protein